MSEKTVVVALGHKALGATLPEQKQATKAAAKAIADLVEDGAHVVISHSNGPQVGMIHTAMNEFGKAHPDYTFAPMSVCSAMSQGYIGYDLQNAIRAELISRGIYKPVATILTQVVIRGASNGEKGFWRAGNNRRGQIQIRRRRENLRHRDRPPQRGK